MRHPRPGHLWLTALAVFMACNVVACSDGSSGGGPPPSPSPSPGPRPRPEPEPAPGPSPSPDPDPDPAPDPDAVTLEVFLEDSPPAYEILRAVRVELERVEVVHFVINETPEGDRPVETLFPATLVRGEVDVLPLRGGRRERIATASVPPGEYSLRLYLSGGEVVTTTQTYSTANGQLTLGGGSDAGSGVRRYVVMRTYEQRVFARAGETQGVIVDMDLEESLVAQGDPGRPTRIDLLPVLRLRDTFAGGLRGVVRSDAGTPDDTSDDVPVENALVRLMQEGPNSEGPDFTGVTRSDAQGVYVLQGVSGGSAVFTLIVSASGHDDHLSPSDLEEPRGGFVTHDVLLRRTSN